MVTFSLSLPPSNREDHVDPVLASDHNDTVTALGKLAQDAGAEFNSLHGELSSKVDDTDPRLTNPRTPTQHTHAVGDLRTYGSASGATFLRGDGMWAEPPGGSGGGLTVVTSTTEPSTDSVWVNPDEQTGGYLPEVHVSPTAPPDGGLWLNPEEEA